MTDLDRILDPGSLVGPTTAELLRAMDQAGDPDSEGFDRRLVEALPRHYSAAEINAALTGLVEVDATPADERRRPSDMTPWVQRVAADFGAAFRRPPVGGA